MAVHGTLRLTGRGAIDSHLTVTGSLDAGCDGTAALGGELILDGDARIAEAGPHSGELRISLAPGSRLHVAVARAGIVIDLAGDRYRLTTGTRDLDLAADAARAA